MNLLKVLQNDYQAISVEARRRYPAIKEPVDRTLVRIRQIEEKGVQPIQAVAEDLSKCEEAFISASLAIQSKQHKIVLSGINALQKLVSHSAYTQERLPEIARLLQSVLQMDDEVLSLKTLQTILSIVDTTPVLNGDYLQQIFQMCFLLNHSKNQVVQSTSSATLRQIVSMIFGRVYKLVGDMAGLCGEELEIKRLATSQAIGFLATLLKDICKVATPDSGASSPNSITTPAFGLELLEAAVDKFMPLFDKYDELQEALKETVMLLLKKWFDSKMPFPVMTRLLRIVSIFIKQYISILSLDCSVFMEHLSFYIANDFSNWQKALPLEVFRSMASTHNFIKFMFSQQSQLLTNEKVLDEVLNSLCRIIRSQFIEGQNVFIRHGPVKFKYLEMLSDVEPPIVPDQYTVSLSLECFVGIIDEFNSLVSVYPTKPESRTPAQTKDVEKIHRLMDSTWLHLSSAFSHVLSKVNDEELSQLLFRTMQTCAVICNVVGIQPAKDSFILSFCGFATPESTQSHEKLPLMTPKNIIATKTLLHTTNALGDNLGKLWKNVLETFEKLDRLIYGKNDTDNSSQNRGNDDLMLSSALLDLFHGTKILSEKALIECVDALISVSSVSVREKSASVIRVDNLRMFGLSGLVEVGRSNAHRVQVIWGQIINHFFDVAGNRNQILRMCAVEFYIHFIASIFSHEWQEDSVEASPTPVRGENTEPEEREVILNADEVGEDEPKQYQEISLDVCEYQELLLQSIQQLSSVNLIDVSDRLLQFLHQILQLYGKKLTRAWPQVFSVIKGLHSNKHLVSKSIKILHYICNTFLQFLSKDYVQMLIELVSLFIAQTNDLSISLSAISLLWQISGFYLPKHLSLSTENMPNISKLSPDAENYLSLVIRKSASSAKDSRPDVRHAALNTLFRQLCDNESFLSVELWKTALWETIFPVLSEIEKHASKSVYDASETEEATRQSRGTLSSVHVQRHTISKQWDETRRVAISEAARMFVACYPSLRKLASFERAWRAISEHIQTATNSVNLEVVQTGVNSYEELFSAVLSADFDRSLWDILWGVWSKHFESPVEHYSRVEHFILLLDKFKAIYKRNHSLFTEDDYKLMLTYVDKIIKESILNHHSNPKASVLQDSVLGLYKTLEDIPWNIWPNVFEYHRDYIYSVVNPKYMGDIGERGKIDLMISMRNIANSQPFSNLCIRYVTRLLEKAPPQVQSLYFESICLTLVKVAADKHSKRIPFETWSLAIESFITLAPIGLRALQDAPNKIREDVWNTIIQELSTLLFSTKYEPPADLSEDEDLYVRIVDCITTDILSHAEKLPMHTLEGLVMLLKNGCSLQVPSFSLVSTSPHQEFFGRSCFRNMFLLCSRSSSDTGSNPKAAISVGKIAAPLLIEECVQVLSNFIRDDRENGLLPLPRSRLLELQFVFEQLSVLRLHPEIFDLEETMRLNKGIEVRIPLNDSTRRHLLYLFPLFIECISVSEPEIKKSVSDILHEIAKEMNLEKK